MRLARGSRGPSGCSRSHVAWRAASETLLALDRPPGTVCVLLAAMAIWLVNVQSPARCETRSLRDEVRVALAFGAVALGAWILRTWGPATTPELLWPIAQSTSVIRLTLVAAAIRWLVVCPLELSTRWLGVDVCGGLVIGVTALSIVGGALWLLFGDQTGPVQQLTLELRANGILAEAERSDSAEELAKHLEAIDALLRNGAAADSQRARVQERLLHAHRRQLQIEIDRYTDPGNVPGFLSTLDALTARFGRGPFKSSISSLSRRYAERLSNLRSTKDLERANAAFKTLTRHFTPEQTAVAMAALSTAYLGRFAALGPGSLEALEIAHDELLSASPCLSPEHSLQRAATSSRPGSGGLRAENPDRTSLLNACTAFSRSLLPT